LADCLYKQIEQRFTSPGRCGAAAQANNTRMEQRATYTTRLERFRRVHRLSTTEWARAAGLSRKAFTHARAGGDLYLRTVRAIVRAAGELLKRTVEPQELFDLGETTPAISAIPRKPVADSVRASYKRYPTNLDRILRGENIIPAEFGLHVGIARQTLLKYRTGQEEPPLLVLERMVRTLRQMTGKPYKARHLYDLLGVSA
jgi:DNA-binding XRE family transcriptional regulator